MTARGVALTTALALVGAALVWLLFVGLPLWYAPQQGAAASGPASPDPGGTGKKIKARLFYVADNGTALTGVEQDVPFGESTIDQAKEIIAAQIAPAGEPLVSAVPPGTTLRALFITPAGEAYADFSADLAQAHPGGSLNEMLTVYTLVDVLTVNLPAISTVQLLIEGKEVETLAGHVDLRRPLMQNLAWVQ
jgi:hypothetical protein